MIDKIKNLILGLKDKIVAAGLLGVLIFVVSYFSVWWAGAVVAFGYMIWKKDISPSQAFSVGTTAGVLVWSAYAGWLNFANEGLLAARIGEMIASKPNILSSANILQITGVIGGLVCGFGGMTGALARLAFLKQEN